MIILKNVKPTYKKTGIFDSINIDGDLVAYAVAAAADGHFYYVTEKESFNEVFRCRYKKELEEFLLGKDTSNLVIKDDYEPDPIENCIHSLKMVIDKIILACGGGEYQIYLTGTTNFRSEINPEYKANRLGKRRPYHLPACRKYLIDKYGATICEGEEADDLLGINQTLRTIIASYDKDLDCVPGWHYNWNKDLLYEVSIQQALYNFYAQVLVGDDTDNIFGVFGIGKTSAKKIIEGSGLTSEVDLWKLVVETYMAYETIPCVPYNELFKSVESKALKVAQQVWIRQTVGEIWQPKEK